MESEARIKGAAVADFVDWYAKDRGAGVMAEAWARIPDAARGHLGSGPDKLLAFRWYPASSVHALIDAMIHGLDEQERDRLARAGAGVVIASTLRGLYRAIFKALISPARYLKMSNTVWRAFHDSGVVEGEEIAPGHHRTWLTGWRGAHPFIVQLNGYAAKEIYEALGCADVTFELREEPDDDGTKIITDIHYRM